LRRLYSSFARGWPGLGLLLLRLVTSAALIHFGIAKPWIEVPLSVALPALLAVGSGLLILAGLWTPVAGTLAAILALSNLPSQSADPWVSVLIAAVGIALALLGPGSWSADARIFGWKQLDLRIGKH
jgi:putative oxidoreductase